jgi:hypothetical protein
MAGGGVIIIRSAMAQALNDPLVYGGLPPKHQAAIDPFIKTDPNTWTEVQQATAFKAFDWAEKHC